jgi:hypothetical protein
MDLFREKSGNLKLKTKNIIKTFDTMENCWYEA